VIKQLEQAQVETDAAKRKAEYQEANRMIMDWLPGVPYAHTKPAVGFTSNVSGYHTSPVGLEFFNTVSIGS